MERRIFLAILLTFVVLYGYQAFFAPPPAQPPASTATPSPAATAASAAASAASATPSSSPGVVATAPATPEAAAVTTEAAEREILVETATVEAVLSNRGGRVLH